MQAGSQSPVIAMSPRALLATVCALAGAALAGQPYQITEQQYYEMPPLFHLDEYERCLATRGVYCLGSFELVPHRPHRLYRIMQEYSSNWVDNFNHTRVHRGLCVSRRCGHYAPRQLARLPAHDQHQVYADWFETCVNETTISAYELPSRLYKLDYCHTAEDLHGSEDLSANERAFAWFAAAMITLSALSTILDVTLTEHTKKGARWMVAWSVRGCWRALTAPPPAAVDTDLRCFDGARVVCMMCIIIEHVCWITLHAYLADTRRFEQTRRALDAILLANSTLVVQIFFLMSSFLLAHKLLQQRRQGNSLPALSTFFDIMVNRVVRISPSYFVVVWFATSWWARGGAGPMWAPLVGSEAAVCQAKWWTHLLYLNNVLYADQKCLIQTWYLAADMQLYAGALLLTLFLWRWRRCAIVVLSTLLLASIGALFALAYANRLMPNYVMHRPEAVRTTYSNERSFDLLYQSPLGNVPGALAGLLLAHVHHALLDSRARLADYKVFRWVSVWSVPLAVWWVPLSPLMLGAGEPARGPAAALAALERPVFAAFISIGLLGAMHGVQSPFSEVLSWRGWSVPARLSFGALLLHMPLNKALVGARLTLTQLDRQTAVTNIPLFLQPRFAKKIDLNPVSQFSKKGNSLIISNTA
ncbi:hypothetical protein O3G_MSEX010927 [Manduca sexta]|uniref:Acyltransferase 3 domain-containing protein n=2 Tax=Manduca sexta TaxID=7130 RepID=A0A922CT68_MANSE|nr:hypothetical protein O3G_MSEX010927 [Manduca sexta]KAG6458585.1 hypothetical protein O3G_MSEX010927 [Manduca sexta]